MEYHPEVHPSKTMKHAVYLVLVSSLWVAQESWAQEHVIAGKVLDAVSEQAVTSGTVTLKGSSAQTTLGPDGVFVLHLPPGALDRLELVVRAPGFFPATVPVPFTEYAVFIILEPMAVELESIEVTDQRPGVSDADHRPSVAWLGNPDGGVARLVADGLGTAGSVSSGAPGMSIDLYLRGVTTIVGSSTPLFVLDGIVVSGASISGGLGTVTGGQPPLPSRIADLNPADIARIRVLRGAAATTLYGSRGANGVVELTTRRGNR